MMLKLQMRIFLNGNSISLEMSNETRQCYKQNKVSAIDLINKCARLRFYLCNSRKANAVTLGKKE